MRPRILLVNPPVHDFTAYDFWLRPYGLLRVAGGLRRYAELSLFDFMDRHHPVRSAGRRPTRDDRWGRGPYRTEMLPRPPALAEVERRYHRFGVPRQVFQRFLAETGCWDTVLVQTTMTYWYPGVREIIEDVRRYCPRARLVLGGVYATLCPGHARGLGADLVVKAGDLEPLHRLLRLDWAADALPCWELYPRLDTGVLKLTEGCPYQCTYCAAPRLYPGFRSRLESAVEEAEWLYRLGARRVALYDDALLVRSETVLLPFLAKIRRRRLRLEFHTPNALHARCLSPDVARAMVAAGCRSFYLGFESHSTAWHARTGAKVDADEFAAACDHLRTAGVPPDSITAYLMLGHPQCELQELEASMHYVHALGARIMLAEYAPVPGTPDGEACRRWIDLDEPLLHNKTAFARLVLGAAQVNRMKGLANTLNQALSH